MNYLLLNLPIGACSSRSKGAEKRLTVTGAMPLRKLLESPVIDYPNQDALAFSDSLQDANDLRVLGFKPDLITIIPTWSSAQPIPRSIDN